MTAKQKAARAKFKAVVAEAAKLRKKNPKLTQAQAVKQAWAISYSKKKTATKKAGKKVAAIKILEKGESKKTKPSATYQQVRTKKGTFKGLKKVGAVTEWGVYVGSKLREKFSDEMAAYRYADLIRSKQRLPSSFVKVKKVRKTKSVGAAKSSEYHKDTKSHNVNIRVVSGMPKYQDEDAAREIQLYADNDSQLYYQKRKPIILNLQKKYQKGTYDIDKAAKLWRYYIDAAMQKYNKEFGSRGDKWYELLSVPDRNLLALDYAKSTKAEFDLGNFI